MKILLITPGKLPVPAVNGGAVENLIQMLLDENECKYKNDITVVGVYNENAEKISKNYRYSKFIFLKINRIKKYIRGFINKFSKTYIGNEYIVKIKKVINFSEYDYVIVENEPQFSLIIRKYIKGKLILHLHNDRLNVNSQFNKEIFNDYDKIITLSNYIRDIVRKIDERHKQKIQTVYNGVDIIKFQKSIYAEQELIELKEKYGIGKNEKILIYSGRIVPEKGVKELVEAYLQIENKSNVKLIISGGIDYNSKKESEYLIKVKKIANNEKNIVFTGYINYDEMPKLYRIADIGIIPSLWDEPFALTVIENLAARKSCNYN